MAGEMPWPPPQGYDPSGFSKNPAGVFPAPPPRNLGPGCWFGAQTPLFWVAGAGEVVRTAQWDSPTFDLRPDLRQAGLANPRANTGALPIWKPMGAGGQLYVQVMNIDGSIDALTNLAVVAIEFAHPSDPNQTAQITTEEDITTAYFTAGKQAAMIATFPPGTGYPIRFWRYRLRFDTFSSHVADPPFTITAAYY